MFYSIKCKEFECKVEKYLSDLQPLVSFGAILDITLVWGLGILVRLLFSFPLSHSLSDVRSVSLLAFCTVTTARVELLNLSSAGAWVNNIAEMLILCDRRNQYEQSCLGWYNVNNKLIKTESSWYCNLLLRNLFISGMFFFQQLPLSWFISNQLLASSLE